MLPRLSIAFCTSSGKLMLSPAIRMILMPYSDTSGSIFERSICSISSRYAGRSSAEMFLFFLSSPRASLSCWMSSSFSHATTLSFSLIPFVPTNCVMNNIGLTTLYMNCPNIRNRIMPKSWSLNESGSALPNFPLSSLFWT